MMKHSNRLKQWILEEFGVPAGAAYPLDDELDICWRNLSKNENAMEILMRNTDKIHWGSLSGNLGATELLYANQDKVCIKHLVSNPHPLAIRLLSENPECIRDWDALLRNPAAVSIWRQHADLAMLDGCYIPTPYLTSDLPPPWYNLGYADPRDKFADLLISKLSPQSDYLDIYAYWNENRNMKNLDHDWTTRITNRVKPGQMDELSRNRNPKIIKILERLESEDMPWDDLSSNPAAIELLERNATKVRDRRDYPYTVIDRRTIWANPAIFEEEYDYEGMRQTPRVVEAELVAVVMHPDRADAYLAAGGTLQEFGKLYGRH